MSKYQTPPGIANKANVFGGAAPGANTAILATSIRPSHDVSCFRIGVVLATASVFVISETSGATIFKHKLNEGAALSAATLYQFTIFARNAYTYNFEVETDGVIRKLQVDEVSGGVF